MNGGTDCATFFLTRLPDTDAARRIAQPTAVVEVTGGARCPCFGDRPIFDDLEVAHGDALSAVSHLRLDMGDGVALCAGVRPGLVGDESREVTVSAGDPAQREVPTLVLGNPVCPFVQRTR